MKIAKNLGHIFDETGKFFPSVQCLTKWSSFSKLGIMKL